MGADGWGCLVSPAGPALLAAVDDLLGVDTDDPEEMRAAIRRVCAARNAERTALPSGAPSAVALLPRGQYTPAVAVPLYARAGESWPTVYAAQLAPFSRLVPDGPAVLIHAEDALGVDLLRPPRIRLWTPGDKP